MKIKTHHSKDIQHIPSLLLFNSAYYHNHSNNYTTSQNLLYNMVNDTFDFNEKEQHIKIHMLLTEQSSNKIQFIHNILPSNQHTKCSFDTNMLHTTLSQSRNKSSPFLSSHKSILSNKKKILIQYILTQRTLNSNIIKLWWKTQLNRIRKKKSKIIANILTKRNYFASIIQRNILSFLFYKQFKVILSSTKFVFFYSLDPSICVRYLNKKNNKIKLRIINAKSKGKDITLPLHFCKILNKYYLPIPLKGPLKRKIQVNFIVNDQCIIDPRYEVECNEKGEYYNIVYHSYLYRAPFYNKTKCITKEEHVIEEKYWESIFKLKKQVPVKRTTCSKDSSNSITSFSSLSAISIDQYLGDINYNGVNEVKGGQKIGSKERLKPILKNGDGSRRKFCKENQNGRPCKKVKFQ